MRIHILATTVGLTSAVLAIGVATAMRGASSIPAEPITPDQVLTRSGASQQAPQLPDALEEISLPKVTYEEVEAAMAAYLECADANGYIIHPWPGEGLRLTRPFLTIPDTADLEEEEQGEAVRAAHKTLTECRRQYLSEAQTAWNAQMEPTDEERLEIFAFMRQCVAEGGRPGTERPAGMGYSGGYTSGPQLDYLIRADQLAMWADCAWALETETGFRAPPPPGGG
jgi:hypothetical protein